MWSAVCSRSSTAVTLGRRCRLVAASRPAKPLYRRGRLHGHAADNTNEETAMTMASALVHRQSQTLVADTSG